MKRKTRQTAQPGLFDAPAWEQEAQARASMPAAPEQADSRTFENHCTLDGAPARIIGTPRTAPYAAIEPVDLDAEPIRCSWDVVDQVMQDGAGFSRADDIDA